MNGLKVPWYSAFSFLFLLFRSNGKNNTWMRTIFVMVMVIISKVPFWNLLDISCFQSSHQLWDTLQWKILLNIRVNSFLDKSHETKMGEDALDIISCAKIRSCSLRNIVPRHFTYYYILFFSETNLVFKFNLAVCLPFYLLILCESWSLFSVSKLFL